MKDVIPARLRPRFVLHALALGGVLGMGQPAISQTSPPPQRFRAASKGLIDSTNVSPLIRARANGHLASMTPAPAEIVAGLEACPDERSRLAFLDALLAGGARSFDRTRTQSQAIEMLMTVAPEDRTCRIQGELERIEEDHGRRPLDWGTLTPGDLVWRPFIWSPETAADRLARLSPSIREALLEMADRGSRQEITAAVLAAIPEDAPEERTGLIRDLEVDAGASGPALMQELARRRATNSMIEISRTHPAAISIVGVRAASAASIARDRPEFAIQMIGGEANISRLPRFSESAMRRGLAEGYRHRSDPELWKIEIAQIGATNERIIAMLGLAARHRDDADPEETNPNRTMEEVKSMRTLGAGRVVSGIDAGLIDRDDAIKAFADLFRTGRYDLAYTFLNPNTTEPTRAADQWLPVRIGLLGEALADADAAPDAWIPLIESLGRLDRLDGQIAALRVIRDSYGRVHGDRELPEDLRLTLDNALIEIAVD